MSKLADDVSSNPPFFYFIQSIGSKSYLRKAKLTEMRLLHYPNHENGRVVIVDGWIMIKVGLNDCQLNEIKDLQKTKLISRKTVNSELKKFSFKV